MKTSKLFLPFLLFICNFSISSQEKEQILDSILNVYQNQSDGIEKVKTLDELYGKTFFLKTPEEALVYAKEQLAISKKINYDLGIGDALYNIGNYHRRTFAFDSARYYFGKANKIWDKTKDDFGRFKTLNNFAKVEQLSGNFEKALKLYEDVVKLAFKMKSGIRIAQTNREIATIYMDKGSYELGAKFMYDGLKGLDSLSEPHLDKKADMLVGIGRIESLRGNDSIALGPLQDGLDIFIQQDNVLWQCITHTEIGYAHLNLGDYEKSLKNFNQSLKISVEQGRKGFEAICYYNLGLVNRKRGNLKLAEEYLNKYVTLGGSSANNDITLFNEFGTLYTEKNEMSKAFENFDKAISMADSIGSLVELKDGYYGRSMAREQNKQFDKALEDIKKFITINDSIFNETKSKQIEELRTIYETEQKEQQIALQQKEITVLEQKAEISTLQKILLAGLLVIFFFAFYGVRQKLKRKKLEKEKVDVELAFKRKELTTHALHLAKKNEVLEGLKQKAEALKEKEESKNGYQQLIRTINFDLQDDNNWENFSRYFEEVHKDFNSNVKSKYPQVTSNELRLLALLKMNLSSKEIANILNISPEGIKKARYRLRKKLDITTEDSLQDLVLSL
ncbi:tetratricopeptide repeat protein [Muricauda sp. JGD-17]|uniref:Tetratricopeptide repeat protein n=1 Tax=Flagellimonas ochracea TaxID=2696472 RepID=A0A964WYZ6_9FLAO|nr:tetratricopeptide repeat protein [Allomuricauda ochracea]NAY93159.1 tetratricopeptide repeat protein [Allomuricauda ochracea]